MEPRLKELLQRMTAPGPFPNMSASEGHELVVMVYELDDAQNRPMPQAGSKDLLVRLAPLMEKIKTIRAELNDKRDNEYWHGKFVAYGHCLGELELITGTH